MLPAIGVLLVAFSEALGVAREFADRHGYEVDPDQELNAHAATNIVSALFGGMLAAGGMSGTAVKEGAGAQSQVANLIAWVATVITLLFLTPLFATLPEAVLGGADHPGGLAHHRLPQAAQPCATSPAPSSGSACWRCSGSCSSTSSRA